MANQFLSLALFLMLLSFFIVMNAMSSFEETRSKPVMDSIAQAFSTDILDAPNIPDSAKQQEEMGQFRMGDTLEILEGLFDAHIAEFHVERNRMGTLMHVHTSVGHFENAIDFPGGDVKEVAIGARGAFVRSMVTLLRSEQRGKPYRIDILLSIPEDPAVYLKTAPNEFLENLKRVSEFAEILEKYGLPKKMISVGLTKGERGFMDLYFYRYKPFDIFTEIKKGNDL